MKSERITWVDSYVPPDADGWCDVKDITKRMHKDGVTIVTIGHVLKEKGGWLAVAGSVHDNRCCSVICIPLCCIIEREDIRESG